MSATQTEWTPPGVPADDLKLVLPGRIEPAGDGWTWIVEGWRLFVKAPLMWVASLILLLVIMFVTGLVPILGNIVFQLVSPVFAAGFVIACRSLERGGEFEIEHLFAGFKTRLYPLVIVGLVTLLGWVAIFLVFAGFVGFSALTAMLTGGADTAFSASGLPVMSILLGLLVMAALAVPLAAAYWFAPALVVMHGMSPLSAMKVSFFGCFRNFIPFLVYGIVMTFFAMLAVIPIGLGFLVWIPVAIASTYVAYRRIFTEGPWDDAARRGVPAA